MKVKKAAEKFPPDFTEIDIEICRTVKPYTMTSNERIYALCRAVEYIVGDNIEGAIVECGVWKGGSMMAVALTLARLKQMDRELYLFDTFEGMPPPTNVDSNFRGEKADLLLQESDRQTARVWAYSPIEEAKANVASCGYAPDKMHFVQGRVEETIPENAPKQIALLRLDTDWYDSTRHEIEHLFPRLSDRGVLIIDDYGHWQGARLAIDEYFTSRRIPILLNRIDYTGRIAIKLPGENPPKE